MRWSIWLLAVFSLLLTGCVGGGTSPSIYGIGWRLEAPDSFTAPLSGASVVIPLSEAAAKAETSFNYSSTASGYWIPDPVDPLGTVVGLQAYRQDGAVRKPVRANWSVSPVRGAFSAPVDSSETYYRPDGPGTYQVQAAIGDAVTILDVEVYAGFVLESGDALAHTGGLGFRFADEVYVETSGEADIYINSDGSVSIPGGFVARTEQYLHDVVGPVTVDGGRTAFGFDEAPVGILVMQTRDGSQIALHLGVAARGAGSTYAYVFGYRKL